MRQQLKAVIEAFLDACGKLERMDMHVTVDLPAKHVSCYGGRPI